MKKKQPRRASEGQYEDFQDPHGFLLSDYCFQEYKFEQENDNKLNKKLQCQAVKNKNSLMVKMNFKDKLS